MKRIIPVLGTSMLFAFAIGAQAEQALTGSQMDVITAGHDYTQDPYQKGDPNKEGDSSLYLPIQAQLDGCMKDPGSCTPEVEQKLVEACPPCQFTPPEEPVCQKDPGKGKSGKHPHHGKRHIVKRHGGKHHGGKRHGGKHHGGWVIAKMSGCGGGSSCGGKMPPKWK